MKVGFIGLGLMGSGMAANLLKAGHAMVVHDARREAAEPYLAAGAEWAASPRALAEAADVIFTSLPGPKEVLAVALGPDGLVEGVAAGTVLFDLTTNSPTTTRQVHAAFAEKGAHVLDAPVSGGPRGAREATLALWIGGDEAVFAKHRNLLGAIGQHIRHVGPVGAGGIAKLVHNGAGYAIQAVLAEMFSMGVKAGADPLALWEAVREGAYGRRRTFDGLSGEFLPGEYEPPRFQLRHALKDVTLAAGLGRDVGVPMRIANLIVEEMQEAVNRGWGERDSRAAMQLQTERAGVEIRVAREDIKRVFDRDPPAKGDPIFG